MFASPPLGTDDLSELYRDLHAHPELSFQETRTAGIIAQRLSALGYEVTTGVGGTGVVGILDNGPGPAVLLRADMDGLPVAEATGLEYASSVRGVDAAGNDVPVMHACGHDVHVTCLLGAAAELVRTRDQFSGRVMLVFQPAEEIGAGAKAMVADRLFERFGRPDVVLGQHVAPLPAGMIGLRAGPGPLFRVDNRRSIAGISTWSMRWPTAYGACTAATWSAVRCVGRGRGEGREPAAPIAH